MDRGRFMFVVVDSAAVRARPARRPPSRHPGEHRRDRHAAGRHRRRLHQEHHQRSHRDASCSARTSTRSAPVNLVVRKLFNPNGVSSWFTSVVAIINQMTLLTVVLTGAAVIREREHGTLEHLLVMPLTAFEIAMAKVWANGLVILVATALSLFLVVQMALKVPFAGSVAAVVRRRRALSVLRDGARHLPRDDLAIDGAVRAADHPGDRRAAAPVGRHRRPSRASRSGCSTLTYFLPSRHFVSFSQVIIYRGGGLARCGVSSRWSAASAWPSSCTASSRFRKSIAVTK